MVFINFNLHKGDINKQIQTEINVNNWKEYRSTMRSFQKSINEYLTELVNLEKNSEGNTTVIEVDDDNDDSEDSEEEIDYSKKPKRVLKTPENHDKIKKLK